MCPQQTLMANILPNSIEDVYFAAVFGLDLLTTPTMLKSCLRNRGKPGPLFYGTPGTIRGVLSLFG